MEKITYNQMIFNFSKNGMNVSIDLTDFSIEGDLIQGDRIYFQTDFGKYETNTNGYMIREKNNSYQIESYGVCKVSNPIEFSIKISSDEGKKQFMECIERFMKDYVEKHK